MKHQPVLETLAEIGIILLLFEVGIESTVPQMVRVGPVALAVAVAGVVAPGALGIAASWLFFPDRFGSIEDARAFGQTFFRSYNLDHRHSGIGFLTPDVVHHGRAAQTIATRQQTLTTAYSAHPERFVRKPPAAPKLPEAA